mgnify:CR=1 FL=1
MSSLFVFLHFIAGKRKKRNTEESEVTSKDNENAAEINADKTDKPAEDQLKTSAIRNTEENEVTEIDSAEATLDDVFVESKKMEKKEKAKQARLAFQTNFKVRSFSKTIRKHFLPD